MLLNRRRESMWIEAGVCFKEANLLDVRNTMVCMPHSDPQPPKYEAEINRCSTT